MNWGLKNRKRSAFELRNAYSDSRIKSAQFKCTGIEPVIPAAQTDKVVMAAALDNAAVFKHHDGIGIADGGEPVSDDKDGAPLHQLIHALFDERFGTGINRACRLIEHDDGRIGDGGTRYGEQLTLPLRKIFTVIFYHRVIALRKMTDEEMSVCELRRFDYLLISRIGFRMHMT